ncbi:uncharacterized protein LOC130807790 [Amaranthus tricolor]|uniref:uncharacterized protein LOC130807790 n=1 Tax=Amaranthus tricolor TaxID=29722 RepID=UPI0025831692|nr:uncharacterized protein LOC130807790 [Amaranthus tricolor]
MLNHVTQQVSDTKNHIQGLIRNREIGDPERHLLNICDQNYNFILTSWLVNVRDALSKRNYPDARDYMRSVPDMVDQCEKSFAPPVTSPISADSKATFDISNVTFDVIVLAINPPFINLNDGQSKSLISKTCSHTSDNVLCASTLNSYPAAANAKDIGDLVVIMVNHVTQQVSDTENQIQGLIRNRAIGDPERNLLNISDQNYNFILTSWLVNVRDALSKRNYPDDRDYMRSVPDMVDQCEKSFAPPITSPISANSKAIFDISKVTFDVIVLAINPPFNKLNGIN